MKQLTIACSDDIEDRVIALLDEAGVEGYIRLGDATGNKFTERGEAYRVMTWPATILLVPGVPDDGVTRVVSSLQRYAASCTTDPCLRVVVASVDEVL